MKTFFQRNILINILLILLLLVGLLFAFFQSLKGITKHGQDATITNVIGHKLPAAVKELAGFEFQIDSIYLPYKDPLEVLYQEPGAGSIVKKGRTIFLTVNRSTPPMVAMPNLVNISFRNAIFTLQSAKLIMGDTIFRPDIAAGSVLEQLYKGKPIGVGSNVPVGSHIDLVVGVLPDTSVNVPNLIGKTYGEVKQILDALLIQYSIVWESPISDSLNAIVYNQQPEAINELDFVNTINPGDIIDLRIMQRPSAELLQMNMPGVKKYFNDVDTSVNINAQNPNEQPINNNTNNNNSDNNYNKERKAKSREKLLEELNATEANNTNNTLNDLNDPVNNNKPEEKQNNNTNNNVVAPKKVEDKKPDVKAKPTEINNKKVDDKKTDDKKTTPKIISKPVADKPSEIKISKPAEKPQAKPEPKPKPKTAPVKNQNNANFKDEYN